jgi:hypothetical protein
MLIKRLYTLPKVLAWDILSRKNNGWVGVIPDFLTLFPLSLSERPRSLLIKDQTFPIVHIKYQGIPSSLKHFNQLLLPQG